MPNIATLTVTLAADSAKYVAELSKADRKSKSFVGSVQSAAKKGATAIAALSTAAAAGLTALTVSAARNADQLAKTSDKLGIATDKLAALQLAGRLTGVQNEKLSLGLQRMTRRIAEAAQGSGEAQDALKELGLDARELAKLPLDQQFQRIAEAMEGVDSQSDKIRLGFKLFDSEGVDLIRTLDIMATDFARIEDEARRFGVAISRVDAKQIENANDAVERAQTAMQGLGTNIAIAIAPLQEGLANAFSDAALESEGFKSEIQATMEALVVGANFAANSVRGIQLAFLGTKLAALQLQEVTALEGKKGSFFRALMGARGPAIAAGSEDRVNEIRDEIDKTGLAVDTLVGKFQSGGEALAKFRKFQEDALRRAREGVSTGGVDVGGTTIEGTATEIFSDKDREALAKRLQAVKDSVASETEVLRQAQLERELILEESFELGLIGQEERDALKLATAQDTASQLLSIERQRIAQQEELEKKHANVVTQLRAQAADTAIALLQEMGARGKAFAVAAIAFEKALAIQKILISSRVAAQAALMPPPIGLGPVAGPALAAAILAGGKVNAALTGALGLAQIANVGSGSSGAPLGTPTNPEFTANREAASQPLPQSEPRRLEITIIGNGVLLQDELVQVLRDAVDADEVFIDPRSRQAMDIRGR